MENCQETILFDETMRSVPETNPESAGLSSYVHAPLEDPSRQIRLVHLLAGKNDTIKIKVTVVDFPSIPEIGYEALSYAWGSEESSETVIVEEEDCTKLQIRANLHLALQSLRLEKASRWLWVDAISINQTDLMERSKQLLLMHRIYRSATQVVAWIGPKTADSDEALDCMDIINSHVAIDPQSMRFTHLSEDERWSNTSEPLPLLSAQITAICNLFHRSWFERLWVWPEIRLGAQQAKIQCGERQMLWTDVRNAVIYLDVKPMLPSNDTIKLLSRLTRMTFLCAAPELTFVDVLHRSRWCKCSDARDRIFTGLILDTYQTELGIQPNYEDSVCDLYTKVALSYIDRWDSLDFLEHVEGCARIPDLPSWVPDWSTEIPAYRLGTFFASGMSNSCVRYVGLGELCAKGLILSRIEKAVPFRVTDTGFIAGDILDSELAAHIRHVTNGIDLSASVEPLRSLCRVYAQDRFSETQTKPDRLLFSHDETMEEPQETFSTREKKENYLRMILGLEYTMGSSLAEFREIRRSLRISYTERSTFLSSDGKYGVAPLEARPGDLVVALLGCGLPLILRQRINNTFQVVGEAYLDGSMYGEAFLGPLPRHFSCVKHFGKSTKLFNFAFRDERTGEITSYDPRLPDFSSEWEFIPKEEDDVVQMFRNKQTGAMRSNWADPRCTAEAFEERGLRLQEFHLR